MCLGDLEKNIDEKGNGEAVPAGCGGSSDSSSPRRGTCGAFLVTQGLCGTDGQTDGCGAAAGHPHLPSSAGDLTGSWELHAGFTSQAPAPGAAEEVGRAGLVNWVGRVRQCCVCEGSSCLQDQDLRNIL